MFILYVSRRKGHGWVVAAYDPPAILLLVDKDLAVGYDNARRQEALTSTIPSAFNWLNGWVEFVTSVA
jgi:hypothetical protein